MIYDRWVVIARDSPLTENISALGLRLCAAGDLAKHFHLWKTKTWTKRTNGSVWQERQEEKGERERNTGDTHRRKKEREETRWTHIIII